MGFVFLTLSTTSFAEVLSVPVGEQSAQSVETPARGKSMQQVENEFGAPLEKSATIGTPPITKWRYDNFTVYFETDIVIHSVIHLTK